MCFFNFLFTFRTSFSSRSLSSFLGKRRVNTMGTARANKGREQQSSDLAFSNDTVTFTKSRLTQCRISKQRMGSSKISDIAFSSDQVKFTKSRLTQCRDCTLNFARLLDKISSTLYPQDRCSHSVCFHLSPCPPCQHRVRQKPKNEFARSSC